MMLVTNSYKLCNKSPTCARNHGIQDHNIPIRHIAGIGRDIGLRPRKLALVPVLALALVLALVPVLALALALVLALVPVLALKLESRPRNSHDNFQHPPSIQGCSHILPIWPKVRNTDSYRCTQMESRHCT